MAVTFNRQLGSYQAFSFITPMLLRPAQKQNNNRVIQGGTRFLFVCFFVPFLILLFFFLFFFPLFFIVVFFVFFSSFFLLFIFSLVFYCRFFRLFFFFFFFLPCFLLSFFFVFFFFFLPGADGPLIYVRAWTLCSFHNLIRTQTFRRALTASIWTAALG